MATDAPAGGIDAVVGYLDEHGVRYEVVEHRITYTAAAEARAAGVPPGDVAKSVLLHDEKGYRLAVVPASERLDLRKARELFGSGRSLRLATEEEMAADFGSFEVGALPPIGPMLPAPEVLDRRLLDHERVLFAGGDHRHGVLIDPNDLVQLTQAKVADICEE
jgi:Ala-tRNA(Pro) deacylase